jgi:hypothetical protein
MEARSPCEELAFETDTSRGAICALPIRKRARERREDEINGSSKLILGYLFQPCIDSEYPEMGILTVTAIWLLLFCDEKR